MATRNQILHEELVKVAPDTKSTQQLSMKEVFLKNLPEVVRDQVLLNDTYDQVIAKVIAYLERHKDLKLRSQDIQLESTF